jgi:hypothetical protein
MNYKVSRYETVEFKALEVAQSRIVNIEKTPIDIISITGMMNDEQFKKHASRYITKEDIDKVNG